MMKISTRWLSSQIMLLVVACWVLGLALIHHLWLVPSIQHQMAREEGNVAVRWIEQALSGLARERRVLSDWGRSWLAAANDAALLRGEPGRVVDEFAKDKEGTSMGLVVVSPDEKVVSTFGWVNETSLARPKPAWSPGDSLNRSPLFPADWDAPQLTGLVAAGGRIALFAREPLGPAASPTGYAIFLRTIDWPMLQDLTRITGVEVAVADSSRPGAADDPYESEKIDHWSSGHGALSAQVNLKDTLGRTIGRVQVTGGINEMSSADRIRTAYTAQLSWLIVAALLTFAAVWLLFIRPLAILVRRLGDNEVTAKRDRLPSGLFAEAGIVARKFASVLDRIVLLSETDPLTGLTNRRQFQILLNHEFQLSDRHRHAMAILMMDIDHFKQVNDKHGHMAGDEVLRAVAETVRAVCRKTDVAARYGGEEFAIILPHTTVAQAAHLGERIRQSLAARSITLPDGAIGVTVSVGVAGFPQVPCESGDELVDRADQALYEAKHAGRNRTVLAGREPGAAHAYSEADQPDAEPGLAGV
ncbi:MAG: hypothetical protein BIFFINMI_01237 [Phycisphaerae bacterium]|nr:hypothetical protein [Phycisphaerae bacterium]